MMHPPLSSALHGSFCFWHIGQSLNHCLCTCGSATQLTSGLTPCPPPSPPPGSTHCGHTGQVSGSRTSCSFPLLSFVYAVPFAWFSWPDPQLFTKKPLQFFRSQLKNHSLKNNFPEPTKRVKSPSPHPWISLLHRMCCSCN